MKLRYALGLAATLSVLAPAGAAFAGTVYDARTLGMGGSSVGYSGNASLAFWNPASVGVGNRFGVYLPSISLAFSNNLLSVGDASSLVGTFQKLGQPASGTTTNPSSAVFTNLAASSGLNLLVDNYIDAAGFSLGHVGPGSMSMRMYLHNTAFARASLTPEFSKDLNGLFFGGGLSAITTTVGKISAAAGDPQGANQQQLKSDVSTLKNQLQTYMSTFIKQNGAATTKKNFDMAAFTGSNAAVAGTYAQGIPLKLAALPDAQLTVGATAKVLVSPFASFFPTVALPGGPNGTTVPVSPLGGGIGASIGLDIDKQTTDLVNAIDSFSQSQDLGTTANLAAKTGAFVNDGLAKSTLKVSSVVPAGAGAGIDLGAAMRVTQEWSVGASLINPILFWDATRSTYQYAVGDSGLTLNQVGSATHGAFYEAEPLTVRLGTAYAPILAGPPALVRGLMLSAGLEAPLYSGTMANVPPTVSLGVEKTFGPLALRLGTSQGGLAPLYTMGLGLQTSVIQANLGVGVDSPSSNLKSAALAFGLGAGF